MKAKRGAKRSGITIGAVAIAIMTLVFFAGLAELLKILEYDSWNTELIENVLGTPLPADAHDVEFGGRTGRGAYLDLTFKASHKSVDAFVSKFCEGPLYQGYDPFNAIDTSIDTKEPPQGAYIIKMNDFYDMSYYSYSLNTSDDLFGIRCLSVFGFTSGNGQSQMQILVDKTSPDVALVKIEALFTCYKCNIPQPTSVPSQKSE